MDVLLSPPSEVPARIEPLAKLPVFWALEGRRVVVAGGSDAAAWKAELLAACGALVDVYAETPGQACLALLARRPEHAAAHVVHHPRRWEAADLNGAALAVADCEDHAEARRFFAASCMAGVPVNVIDKPDPGATVCSCLSVGVNQIVAAVRDGCHSVETVGVQTTAGTNCGSCRAEIKGIIDGCLVVAAE